MVLEKHRNFTSRNFENPNHKFLISSFELVISQKLLSGQFPSRVKTERFFASAPLMIKVCGKTVEFSMFKLYHMPNLISIEVKMPKLRGGGQAVRGPKRPRPDRIK